MLQKGNRKDEKGQCHFRLPEVQAKGKGKKKKEEEKKKKSRTQGADRRAARKGHSDAIENC